MNKPLALALFFVLAPTALFIAGVFYESADGLDAPPPADYAECRDRAYRGVTEICEVFDEWECNRHLREALESCRYAFPETAPELAPEFRNAQEAD